MLTAVLAALALAQAAPAPAAAADAPGGMPADDYGAVAWCRGALTGHMELYALVKPELRRVEAEKAERLNAKLSGDALKTAKARQAQEAKEEEAQDAAQMKAGRDYIVLYGEALDAAEAGAPEGLHDRGLKEIADGDRIWSAARAANNRDRMWSWLMWELPARCETAAKRLKANAGLFGDAFKADAAPAPASPDAKPADAPAAEAPAPAAADTSPPAPPAG